MKAMCESSGSDVSIDEFLRAVAILKRGSAKDRLKFVFKMCDVDHTGKLQSSGLSNFLVTLHGRHILENVEYRRLVSEGFDHGHARLSLDEFLGVLVDKNASDILIDWMEHFADILCEQADPQLLETQEEYNPIVQQKILASESRFTIKEIALLQDAFIGYRFDHSDENTNTRIKATSNGDHIDLDSMMSDFPLDISEEKFVKAFSSFGPRANGVDIDIFSFVHALAIACRGTVEEKAKFAFLLFGSSDSDSKLTRDGLYDLLRLELFQNSALGDRVSKFILDSTDFSSNHSSPDKDKRKKSNIISVSLANLMNSTIGTSGSSVSKPKVTGTDLGRFVDHIILEYSSNSNKLSLDDFMRWSAAVGYEMLSLRIMREVAFVDLGLVPNSREEELYIANSCYKAFDPSEIVEDEHWYLVERKWFDHWCKYTQFQFDEVLPSSSSLVDISAKHSHSAPSNLSGAASGAALSSSSSSASKKDPPNVDSEGNYLRPRSINNDGLLTSQSLLTPDRKPNRVLKSSDDIKLGKHFAVVCDQLWFALKSWYGGGPEIKRTVVMRADGSGLLLDIWESEVLKEDKENEETDNEDTEGDIDVPRRSSSRKQLLCLQRRMRAGGSAGLVNLGNTCYMNSALQCLSSTQLLAEYFLSGMYLDDINRTSTLGLQGKLAEVYGKLIEDMWCAKQKAISPRDFKKTIAKFNEAFRGTEQQDAQELLAFLLSGLSEDLNRIHEKPYVEQPDSDGRFDGDLADEWWRNHLRREVSIIVALFTGQYKSLLTCSRCGFKSARFEPFTFLQVPLPEPTHTNVAILLVLANGLPPVRVSVRLSITATIYELKQELKKICNEYELGYQVAEMDIKIAEYSGSMILTFKSDSRRVAQIRSIDRLIAFQLEPLTHEIIKATRNRRPSYNVVSSSSGGMGMSFEDLEAEKVIQDHFLECLKPGMLVEIKSRSQSVDCLPGIVLDVLPSRTENRNNFAQQSQVAIRFKHGAGEMKVSLNRIRPRQPRLLYIPLVSRKLSYSALYFKNPFRPVAFGLPNLLRLCPELTTGYELYQMVWKRVHRFVSDNRKVVPPDVWIHSSAIDESLVCCKIDEVFASSPTLSSCGFVLRRVESKAQTDSRATWLSRSFGQTIPCTHEPLDVMEEETIAIDWDLNVFQDRDTQDKMKQIDSHYSLAKNETIDKGPVPLSHCIDAFTLEEKINEVRMLIIILVIFLADFFL
jgi:ubiquitin carboxyl-terminal hydrolase 6/32